MANYLMPDTFVWVYAHLIDAAAVSIAVGVIWSMWCRPVIKAFKGFFDNQVRIMVALEEELPTLNKSIVKLMGKIEVHEDRISSLEAFRDSRKGE